MSMRLRAYVHVGGRVYGPDSDVPPDVAARIGAYAWEGGDTAAAGRSGSALKEPPRSGRGSGVAAWRSFAEAHGVGVDSDMSREDIIAACETAGVIQREE